MKELTIVLVPLSSFISHVTRCLCIADELRKRGHHAEFICSESNRELIKNAGYKTHLARQLNHAQIVVTGAPKSYLERYQNKSGNECDHSKKFGLKEMATDEFKILEGIKPDLVICDASPTSFLCATVLKIPCLMVKNILGYIGSGHVFANKHLGLKLEDELDFAIELKMSAEFRTDCEKLNQAYIDSEQTIPLLIPGAPEIEKINGFNLLSHHPCSFVGSFEWKGWGNTKMPDPKTDSDKIMILVSMGSSFPFESVIRTIIKSFDDDTYRIIVNTGGQVQIPDGLSVSNNYEIHPFLNLEAYLEVADVLICHGGHGSIMSAFKTGTPSLSIPFNGDQMVISRQVEKLGCGLRIKQYPDDVSSKEIKEAIKSLLIDPDYAANALRYGLILKEQGDGAINAVDYIERFYENRRWSIETTSQINEVLKERSVEPKNSGFKVLFAMENRTDETAKYCRSIAEELKKFGHVIGFIYTDDQDESIDDEQFDVFPMSVELNEVSQRMEVDDQFYSKVTKMTDLDDKKTLKLLRNRIKEDKVILENYKPDLLIDAGRITCSIIAESMDISLLDMFNHASKFASEDQTVMDSNASQKQAFIQQFSVLLTKVKREFLKNHKKNELKKDQKMSLLFPATPSILNGIEEGRHSRKKITYLGGIEFNSEQLKRKVPASLFMNKIVVLLIMDHQQRLEPLLEIFQSHSFPQNYEVIPVCSHLIKSIQENEDKDNPVICGVDLNAFIKISDVVIHSGNFEHLQCALKNKKPSLIVPWKEDEVKLTNLALIKGWGRAIFKTPSEIKQYDLHENIQYLIETKESINQNLQEVSKELHFWDNGGKRGAYAINQMIQNNH